MLDGLQVHSSRRGGESNVAGSRGESRELEYRSSWALEVFPEDSVLCSVCS